MIDAYKRLVFWQLRWMSHVPGLRAYSRFFTRQYERRFWTTWILSTLASWYVNRAIIRWFNRRIDRVINNYEDDVTSGNIVSAAARSAAKDTDLTDKERQDLLDFADELESPY